jgi:hypothetical protein
VLDVGTGSGYASLSREENHMSQESPLCISMITVSGRSP